MIKANKLEKGDKVAIISPSNGILGEKFCQHQLALGIKRLKQLGLEAIIMPNALKGTKYLADHPEARYQDLKAAYYDPEIKAIICAIGGFDSHRLIPYLFEDQALCEQIKSNPKIFMGFSDATQCHLFFYQLGVSSSYAHSFLCDFAELDQQLLPYTEQAMGHYFENQPFEIYSSPVWYQERRDFSINALNTPRLSQPEKYGYEVLQGAGKVTGKLLGGCVETLYELLTGERFPEQKAINQKYGLFPPLAEWKGKILFLETSEEKPTPEQLLHYLTAFKSFGIFEEISGLILGKPQDEAFYHEYHQIYKKVINNPHLAILSNLNFGHCYPRTIIPYGIEAEIDLTNKRFRLLESMFT